MCGAARAPDQPCVNQFPQGTRKSDEKSEPHEVGHTELPAARGGRPSPRCGPGGTPPCANTRPASRVGLCRSPRRHLLFDLGSDQFRFLLVGAFRQRVEQQTELDVLHSNTPPATQRAKVLVSGRMGKELICGPQTHRYELGVARHLVR